MRRWEDHYFSQRRKIGREKRIVLRWVTTVLSYHFINCDKQEGKCKVSKNTGRKLDIIISFAEDRKSVLVSIIIRVTYCGSGLKQAHRLGVTTHLTTELRTLRKDGTTHPMCGQLKDILAKLETERRRSRDLQQPLCRLNRDDQRPENFSEGDT